MWYSFKPNATKTRKNASKEIFGCKYFLKLKNVAPTVNYREDFAFGPSFAFLRFSFSSFWSFSCLQCDSQIIVSCFIIKNVAFLFSA